MADTPAWNETLGARSEGAVQGQREHARAGHSALQRASEFRRASTAVRVPYRQRLLYWIYYIALAHRGTPVYSATRDAQYADGFYRRRYDRTCEKINRRLERAGPRSGFLEIPSFGHGELEPAEVQRLLRLNVPFVIRDGARDLPAADWSLEYLERVAGSCQVPINDAPDRPEEDRSRPTKAHRYYRFHTGTLSQVVASIRSGGNMRIGVAEDVMHHDGGRLRRDLDIPYWERMSGWEQNQHHWFRSRLFVGKVASAQLILQPPGAFTLWHAEPGDNFFVLVRGEKTWTLAHPYYTAAMRPRVKPTTNYSGSNIDVREPDEVQRQRGFAGYLGVPRARVDLRAGDVLRVPNHWWHTAETHPDHYAIAASIRSEPHPNLVGPGYVALRMLDRQYHAMVKAFQEHGRITDRHIGYPRRSRSETEMRA